MSSYQNTHIFSQGGDLSQLTGGFAQENYQHSNNEDNIQGAGDSQQQDETLSSRADAICEENRQINRFVEGSLKQLEKKRIKLTNKEKTLYEEEAKLLETQQRHGEQNFELQMHLEEWSSKYSNGLKQRDQVAEKLKQVQEFIKLFESNLAKGVAHGDNIEEAKQRFETEFDTISKKSKAIQEEMKKIKSTAVAELEKKASKCSHLKDNMMKEREVCVNDIQTLASKTDESLRRISVIQEGIEKATQRKLALTQLYSSLIMEHKELNESVTQVYQELNETKSVTAARIQHLKLKINTEENHNHNQEIKLEEKENSLHSSTTKLKESTNLSNQIQEAVGDVQKHIEKKSKEIDMCNNKKSVLNDQASTLIETMKTYANVENENNLFKDQIPSLKQAVELNIQILTEKENNVNKLSNKVSELEKTYSDLRENKFKLGEELQYAQDIEKNLTCNVKENKIQYEEERKRKQVTSETLMQRNEQLKHEIATCTSKLAELQIFNDKAKENKEEIKICIERCKESVKINEDKYLKETKEQASLIEEFEEKISLMKNDLDKCELYVIEAKPKQKELSLMLTKKEALEKEIKLVIEKNQEKINTLENNHSAKIQEMDNEMEKYSSIMKNIVTAEEDTTNKLKEEIRIEEKSKTKLEDELRPLQQKLKSLKNMEMIKRNKIVKMEKRQQTIMEEIKVTREDIAQAVTGKVKESQPSAFTRTRLMTPSSASGSFHSRHGRVGKKVEGKENVPNLAAQSSKQENTRKWVESVPDDEYEFSEI